ncbi:hypothetical protein X797_008845 [Metarhizium robertsii]|uniref:Uncharacterized protein n=1 Tax=Metarhizium robertsii TaxID=568076 RepID=A0A014P6F9_9HYPO|nr:hypothetical protein X797_008845 [Metarhizium robertsii]
MFTTCRSATDVRGKLKRGLDRKCDETKVARHPLQAVQESLVLQAEMVEPNPKPCVVPDGRVNSPNIANFGLTKVIVTTVVYCISAIPRPYHPADMQPTVVFVSPRLPDPGSCSCLCQREFRTDVVTCGVALGQVGKRYGVDGQNLQENDRHKLEVCDGSFIA